jgi:hypothetical protein
VSRGASIPSSVAWRAWSGPLDAILPAFDWNEIHECEVAGSPGEAVSSFLEAPLAPDRGVRWLLRARGLGSAGTVAALFERMRFTALHRSAEEMVFGATGTPWRPSGGIGPFGEPRRGVVHVAIDVRAVTGADGRTVLSTETRIAAADAAARRAFGRYWRVVRPFSGMTRRSWLRAAARSLAARRNA